MDEKLGGVFVEVRGDTSRLPFDFASIGPTISSSLTSQFTGLAGRAAAIAAPLAIAGAIMADFNRELALSAESARKQAEADMRLEFAVAAAGQAVGVTSDELRNLAGEIQSATGIADDEIQGLQSALLKFGNIQGDVLKRATRIGVDMSAQLGIGLPAVSQRLGRALNDPAKALTHLKRVVGELSDSQKALIENTIKAGDASKSQAAILDVLAKKFGGAAAASAKGPCGDLKKLKAEIDDLRELLGNSGVNIEIAKARVEKAKVGYYSQAGSSFIEGLGGILQLPSEIDGLRRDLGIGTKKSFMDWNQEGMRKVADVADGEGILGQMFGQAALKAAGYFGTRPLAYEQDLQRRKFGKKPGDGAGDEEDDAGDGKGVKGFFSPMDLAKKIQESMFGKNDKMLQIAEASKAIQQQQLTIMQQNAGKPQQPTPVATP